MNLKDKLTEFEEHSVKDDYVFHQIKKDVKEAVLKLEKFVKEYYESNDSRFLYEIKQIFGDFNK